MPCISSPSASVGTMNIVRPSCLPPSVDVRATSRMCFEMWALEHHVFWPLTTQPFSVFSALQVRPPTSDPAPGSDIEIASSSPLITSPSSCCFCSSEPLRSRAAAVMIVVPKPPMGIWWYEVSSRKTSRSVIDPPEPPYASGSAMPSQPWSAILR